MAVPKQQNFSQSFQIQILDQLSFNALTMNPRVYIRHRVKRGRRKETLIFSPFVVSSEIDLVQAIQQMEGNSNSLPFPYFTTVVDFLFLKYPEIQNSPFLNMHKVYNNCLFPLEQG